MVTSCPRSRAGPGYHLQSVRSLAPLMTIRVLACLGELAQDKQTADAGQERQRLGLPRCLGFADCRDDDEQVGAAVDRARQ